MWIDSAMSTRYQSMRRRRYELARHVSQRLARMAAQAENVLGPRLKCLKRPARLQFGPLPTCCSNFDRGHAHGDHRAALGLGAVGELKRGAGPLEQRLGDEEAEPHADMLVGRLLTVAWAGRVVTNGSPSCSSTYGGKPAPSSAITILTSSFDQRASTSTLLAAKSMAFSTQIAEPVEHARVPLGHRLAALGLARHSRSAAGPVSHLDRHGDQPVRRTPPPRSDGSRAAARR